MVKGIIIPLMEIPGVSHLTSPLGLSLCSEEWKKDINRFGPWDLRTDENGDGSFKFYHSHLYENHHEVLVFEECSSAMDLVFELHKTGHISEWGSVISASQTKGRGRLGRKWVSSPGNLHASVLFPDLSDEFINLDAVFAAVLVINYLLSFGIKADLKWPNDIVLEEKKIAGILVEKKNGLNILGIGINLKESPDFKELRDGFVFPAGTLRLPGNLSCPLSLWLDMFDYIRKKTFEIVFSWKRADLVAFMEERLLWKGDQVKILDTSSGEITGTILGIGADGALRILDQGRERYIYSGTVLRLDY